MKIKSVIVELWVWIWAESIIAKLEAWSWFPSDKIRAWIVSFTLNKAVGLAGIINRPEKLTKLYNLILSLSKSSFIYRLCGLGIEECGAECHWRMS